MFGIMSSSLRRVTDGSGDERGGSDACLDLHNYSILQIIGVA